MTMIDLPRSLRTCFLEPQKHVMFGSMQKVSKKKKLSLSIISAFLHDRSTSESEMEGPGEEGCQ